MKYKQYKDSVVNKYSQGQTSIQISEEDFNIKSSVHWSGVRQRIYIKKESSEIFKNTIQSFICPFMKYKLH